MQNNLGSVGPPSPITFIPEYPPWGIEMTIKFQDVNPLTTGNALGVDGVEISVTFLFSFLFLYCTVIIN